MLVIYPTAVFAQGWHLLESKTDKQDIFTEELRLHVPSPRCGNAFLAESGWYDGCGISRKSFMHRTTHPQKNGQPLRSVGARPRLLLATSTGGIFIYKEKNKGFLNFKWEALWLKYEV